MEHPLQEQQEVNPLCRRETIQALRKKHLFALRKSLGQNFLVNPKIPQSIVKGAGVDGSMGVLEIGPGIGCLTWELRRHAARVVAVEIDEALLPVLAETLPYDNVTIVQGDILKVDIGELLQRHFAGLPVAVVANLPYYITTPIIAALLEGGYPLRSITVMVQQEVAQRLCAPPGSPDSGAISLMIDYYCRPRILFRVPPESFTPPPKVESAVIHMVLRDSPAVTCESPRRMFSLIRQGYGQRRKTLVNAVGNLGNHTKQQVGDALSALKLPRDIRAERMTLEQFARLSDLLGDDAAQ